MTNKFKFLLSGVVACTLCASVALADTASNAAAPAAPAPATVAVVDVQAVVNASPAVQALKKEQEANAKELITFIEKARKDVAATTDESKKKSLEEKYNKELVSKREKFEKSYTAKLSQIDSSISKTIEETAKAKGYTVVVAKGAVLYGGADLTNDVKKAVAAKK